MGINEAHGSAPARHGAHGEGGRAVSARPRCALHFSKPSKWEDWKFQECVISSNENVSVFSAEIFYFVQRAPRMGYNTSSKQGVSQRV